MIVVVFLVSIVVILLTNAFKGTIFSNQPTSSMIAMTIRWPLGHASVLSGPSSLWNNGCRASKAAARTSFVPGSKGIMSSGRSQSVNQTLEFQIQCLVFDFFCKQFGNIRGEESSVRQIVNDQVTDNESKADAVSAAFHMGRVAIG